MFSPALLKDTVRVDKTAPKTVGGQVTRGVISICPALRCRVEAMSTRSLSLFIGRMERPTYTISWISSPVPLEAGMVVTYKGRKFILKEVRYDDAGDYWVGALDGVA